MMGGEQRLGVAVLAGGMSSRMGSNKALLSWDGQSASARFLALASRLGAHAVIAAGGPEFGLARVEDGFRHGGPVGGVLVGLEALAAADCSRALVLAVDAALLSAGDLGPLLGAASRSAAYEGLNLPFVIELATAPIDVAPNVPLSRFLEQADTLRLTPPPRAQSRLQGANTPDERFRLLLATGRLRRDATGVRKERCIV